jgi:Fe-S-cluster containining protein
MSDLTPYQHEQLDALELAIAYLEGLTPKSQAELNASIEPYLDFRVEVDAFLKMNFSGYCTHSCYTTQTSACCSRDGIITFWADVLINANASDRQQLERLQHAISNPLNRKKCIYLGSDGCIWRVRPLVCAMFVCDDALAMAFEGSTEAECQWEEFKHQAKGFRWPDRPVLFDQLEKRCIAAGVDSSLMYLHSSPGLLRVKRKAGLTLQ